MVFTSSGAVNTGVLGDSNPAKNQALCPEFEAYNLVATID